MQHIFTKSLSFQWARIGLEGKMQYNKHYHLKVRTYDESCQHHAHWQPLRVVHFYMAMVGMPPNEICYPALLFSLL